MKRTPLKRTRTKPRRAVHPVQPARRKIIAENRELEAFRIGLKAGTTMHDAVDLRKLAKGQPCYLQYLGCRRDSQYTVLAHIRIGGTAGMGMKPPDVCAVPACDHCHDWLDSRNMAHGSLNYEQILCAQNQWLAHLWNNGILKT